MTNITQDFGIQSWCLRGFDDNVKVAQMVKELGLNKIELCGKHVKFDDESTFDDVIKIYNDAGITIQSLGVESFGTDEAAARKRFEFARKTGQKHISVNFNPDTFAQAHPIVQKLAEEYDIRCGIHNHGGYHWLGSSQILRWVFSEVGDRIGLCLDCAWALNASQDPVKMAEEFSDRLFAIHLKDFVFHSPTGKHEDVAVGTGNLDLPALKAVCEKSGFDGEAILEYERPEDVNNPIPPLTQCVEAIRAVN